MIQKIIKAFQALIVFLILLILVYPLIIVSSYYLVFRNKVYPKVDVINFNLGGQDKKTALEILTNKINEANIKNIIIEYQDKTWEINLNELGFNYLTKETVDQAYNFGRDEDLKKDIILKWKAWQQGILFGLDYNLNNHLLEEQIATISSTINIPAIPPTIEIKQQPTKEISIEPGKSGKKVDEKQLYQSIKNNLSWLNNEKINLPVEDIYFLTSEQQIDDTKKRAQNLLNKTIILSWQQNQWPLEEKEIINFLNFNYGFDDNKIASYTAQLARSIDRSAENALFNFDNGRVIEFKPAENGQILDQKKPLIC